MKPTDRENAQVALTESERKTVTVEFHRAFKDSIAKSSRTFDEVDELVEELRAAEFEREASKP